MINEVSSPGYHIHKLIIGLLSSKAVAVSPQLLYCRV